MPHDIPRLVAFIRLYPPDVRLLDPNEPFPGGALPVAEAVLDPDGYVTEVQNGAVRSFELPTAPIEAGRYLYPHHVSVGFRASNPVAPPPQETDEERERREVKAAETALAWEYLGWRNKMGLHPTGDQAQMLRRMEQDAEDSCGEMVAEWMSWI